MKRITALIFMVIMLLAFAGCSQEPEAVQEGVLPVPGEGFRVGFGRASITPQEKLPLGGYGTSSTRIMEDVLDDIYVDCIAMTDENDLTVLLMLVDMQRIEESLIDLLRISVNEATGVPQDRILISCSHTHSVPDLTMNSHEGIARYKGLLVERFAQSAVAALRDRLPAQLYGGTTQTEGLSFVRHYYSVGEDGSVNVFGDNFGSAVIDETTQHMADAMESMRVLQFTREGAKDIVLCSFQAHPHLTGGSSITDLSSDYVGPFREAVEYSLDVHCAFIQGTGGNLNETSKIPQENFSTEKNHREYGYRLAQYCVDCLENKMQALEAGPLQCKIQKFTATVDHSQDSKLADALLVSQFYSQNRNQAATREYAAQFGISSYFHATSIKTRAGLPQTADIELGSFAIGSSVGFYVAPGELFAQAGMEMEAASPFAITVAVCLADGDWKYFPYGVCAQYASYESDYGRFVPSTCEQMMQLWLKELNTMYESGK